MMHARRALLSCALLLLATLLSGQQPIVSQTAVEMAGSQSASARLISFSDSVEGQPDGALTVTFAIYNDQPGSAAVWTETQLVQITGGKYTVLLGSRDPAGLPASLFADDQAHWLGVQVNGAEKRHLMVSVPYAMKAVEAQFFGGLLPSQYVTLAQLQSILQNSTVSAPAITAAAPKTNTFVQTAAAVGSTPQPATDFTDNNGTEVLLVTQQGPGYAVHAISNLQPAIYAENSGLKGTALQVVETSTDGGASTGLFAQTLGSGSIAGVFDSAGPMIMELRKSGMRMVSFDQFGDIMANGQVQAFNFAGAGFGLTNIPNSATTATPANSNNTIVARDQFGGFAASQVQALNFVGGGFGLTNIPNSATTATPANIANSIVTRDPFGGFVAGQVQALNFVGGGFGLMNIPPAAVGATRDNIPNAIVARDQFGGFVAGQVQALNFVGGGFGLTNVPNSATTATDTNTPGAIVARDSFGNFAVNQISAFALNLGLADFSNVSSTAPVKAVLSINTPALCQPSKELLIKTDALPGQQLFICNASGNGYVLVGDGVAAGVTSVAAGDSSITVGGTSSTPTLAVANGSITSAKLAANAITSVNIADGSLPPTKITGTVATLGNNTFSGSQTVQQNLTVFGAMSSSGASINGPTNITGSSPGALTNLIQNGTGAGLAITGGNTGLTASANNVAIAASSSFGTGVTAQSTNSFGVFASSVNSTGIHGDGGAVGVDASSVNGVALQVRSTGTTTTSPVATFSSAVPGKLISGRLGNGPGSPENFAVDTSGNVISAGALTTQYPLGGSIVFNTLVRLAQGISGVQAFQLKLGDNGPAVGVGIGATAGGPTGNLLQVAYEGVVPCNFDFATTVTPGDYVGVSPTSPGFCRDLGTTLPSDGRQVIGRVVGLPTQQAVAVMLFGPEQHSGTGGTLTTINTGAGLTGGPISSSGTVSIVNNGVTNAMLQNSAITLNPGVGLSGGGAVPLGGVITLNNSGALSFNGRTGNLISATGDYSFAQIAGIATPAQLPATTAFTNQSNTFSGDQSVQGNLSAAGNVTANSVTSNLLSVSGSASASSAVLSVLDSGAVSPNAALSANSQNNVAALFMSSAPTIMVAGTSTHGVFSVNASGISVVGNITGTTFSGDGSGLTNLNAAKVGSLAAGDIASTAALNAETTARQADVASLQTSVASEATARQAAEASLSSSITAETSARQSDVSNLQGNINAVKAADAKLSSSNTFTAGTQDFSAAAATLPVRAVLSASTPGTCVAGKELLIKIDAPAGQQLFICNANGSSWNLVGDGASGGVTSFNGRSGGVSSAANDYSFSQISGSITPSQLPALTGDVFTSAGSNLTLLSATGVAPGSYSKVAVDSKGRVTVGGQATFSDLSGFATPAQLPANVVYSDKANTFNVGQTVNGTMSASSFTGNGSGLTNVNAATLNGIAASGFVQLAAANSFAAKQTLSASTSSSASLNVPAGTAPAAPIAGDMWNTGNAIQYRDSASTIRTLVSTTQPGGMQLLKLAVSITPANVASQTCNEQSFAVTGISSTDLLIGIAQPSTTSPGTNIAIGGWRVSAANTVAVQFCNVSRNSSTPAAGSYTFVVMR